MPQGRRQAVVVGDCIGSHFGDGAKALIGGLQWEISECNRVKSIQPGILNCLVNAVVAHIVQGEGRSRPKALL